MTNIVFNIHISMLVLCYERFIPADVGGGTPEDVFPHTHTYNKTTDTFIKMKSNIKSDPCASAGWSTAPTTTYQQH